MGWVSKNKLEPSDDGKQFRGRSPDAGVLSGIVSVVNGHYYLLHGNPKMDGAIAPGRVQKGYYYSWGISISGVPLAFQIHDFELFEKEEPKKLKERPQWTV